MPSSAEADRVVGKVARVSVPIPGGAKAGEVVVRIRGGTEAYIAYSDQQIDAGTEVVVMANLGARSVSVAPL